MDTDVAQHLMRRCVLELLGGKTRILCTHRIEFVEKADVVVLMENGAIIRTGGSSLSLSLHTHATHTPRTHHTHSDSTQQETQAA